MLLRSCECPLTQSTNSARGKGDDSVVTCKIYQHLVNVCKCLRDISRPSYFLHFESHSPVTTDSVCQISMEIFDHVCYIACIYSEYFRIASSTKLEVHSGHRGTSCGCLLAIDAADPLQHLPGFIVIATIEEPHGTLLAAIFQRGDEWLGEKTVTYGHQRKSGELW